MQLTAKNNWHNLDTSQTITTLQTNLEKGLQNETAQERLLQHGSNVLTIKKGKGALHRFLLHFHQPLVYILLAATAITFWLGEWIDSGVIFTVVLINAIVGFLQESRALKALAALSETIRVKARIIRGGKTLEITASELVPGDIVLLQSGEKVPADLRLLHTHELRVDESTLTGESLPVNKNTTVLKENTVLADRKNMAFASTLVTYGQCKGAVTSTGNNTEIGHISKLISETKELDTPLTRKIRHFSKVLLYAIMALATITFFAGAMQEQPLEETFMAAVALAVAAIPEGLPAAFTIILAIGVSRMAKRHAIIRKMPAVETLGGTTVICSDKTGTLTVNKMTVQEITAGGKRYFLTGNGYNPRGQLLDAGTEQEINPTTALKECLLAGLLCNDSILVQENKKWKIQGDPTEGSLIVAARKAGLTEEHYLEAMPRIGSIPFESEYQYMATMHHHVSKKQHLVYVKGAVEAILAKCTNMATHDGKVARLDHPLIMQEVVAMAERGMRVLAFARIELPSNTNELTHKELASGLTFLGIQGMIDPPRQEAIDAIAACHTAGISVKMITGDHAVTASAIATQMNLSKNLDKNDIQKVLTGKEIATLSDNDLKKAVKEISVFARVTPEQKLRLVQALQSQGEIVAMTGDGVNDAPALRQADIGVAMGLGGTEVAKEAADMVLIDDNFVTIKKAIEEGRCVFDNLTKFIIWTLPTNMGEALILLCAIFAGVTLPVLPIHVLWINMSTALLLGLMLAFERKEGDLMQRMPRSPQAPILTGSFGFRIIMVSVLMTIAAFILFQWELQQTGSINNARTAAVNVIVFVEMFYLFNCRSLTKSSLSLGPFSNHWIIVGVLGMITLQLLFTYLPLANHLFQTAPISFDGWLRITASGLAVSVFVGFEKWVQNHLANQRKLVALT